jgi:hypothetical protein
LPSPVSATTENGNSFVSVYPNPSAGMVTVLLSDDISFGSSLEIYNQVGQKVASVIVNQSQFQFNASSLSKGVYYIKVNDGHSKVMTKLLKL